MRLGGYQQLVRGEPFRAKFRESWRPFAVSLLEEHAGEYLQRPEMQALSAFLRDYLYIPLGGNRVSNARWYVNILVTFFISGLWHGANWTFVAWGLLCEIGGIERAAEPVLEEGERNPVVVALGADEHDGLDLSEAIDDPIGAEVG